MIRFGYCAHGLGGLELEDSIRLATQCGFTVLDLGANPGARQIPQRALAGDPKPTGRHIRSLLERYGAEAHELFLCFVEVNGEPAKPDSADDSLRSHLVEQFKPICDGAVEAGFASIMLAPGDNPDNLPPRESLERAAETLREMYAVARAAGIGANVEPSWNTIINSRERVDELRELLPELRLTLDYAHFTGAGRQLDVAYELHEIAAHIHLKPATYSEYKVPFSRNEVDFAAIIRRLVDDGWSGVVSAETIYPVGETDPDRNPVVQGALVLEAARAGLHSPS